jgi:peptidoglycan hydrolase-like protein with peptidoglycan-binding domain
MLLQRVVALRECIQSLLSLDLKNKYMTNTTKFLKNSVGFVTKTGLLAAVALVMAVPALANADAINRQLELGMSGSDVSTLQTFLAQDATLYPQGKVTGYFGFLTKSAVSNFQTRNNISAVGRVGPATLPVLNAQIASGMNGGGVVSSGQTPIISGTNVITSRNNATVNWYTNSATKGVVYYSTSPLSTYENANSVNVSGSVAMTDTNLRTSQNVALSGLLANTTYYYLVYTTDQEGDVSVTWPATFQTTN